MAACTDCLALTNHKLFKTFRRSLGNVTIKTQSIIEYKNDMLFVWNALDENVLTINVKTSLRKHGRNKTYQSLLPTDPPGFRVEHLLCSGTATQVALVGPRGISVMELPRRWGKDSSFQGDKSSVTCRCRNLDERYFVCNPLLEVRRVRWHPGSSTDTHVLVLSSDNSLRLYETSTLTLLQIWGLGPRPRGALSSAPKLPFLVGLGNTAIDFDFTPPSIGMNLAGGKIEGSTTLEEGTTIQWPILVLHGNGDVYKLSTSLEKDSAKCRVYGPLTMSPPAEDNYGVEACSILCLQCTPPVVVIAASTGTLYHCLLLNSEDEDENLDNKSSWSRSGSTYSLHTPDMCLFVLESIELELGLDLDEQGDGHMCPIHLHRYSGSNNRYLCSHDAGIHALAVPLITELERFLSLDDANIHLQLLSLSQPSIAEYLVCTRTSATDAVPVLGLVVLSTPAVLVALMGTGEVVSLPLASVLLMLQNAEVDAPRVASHDTSPLKVMLKESFETRIRALLKHNLTQPIFKLGLNSNMSVQDCLELVTRTTQLLREEYLQRHDRVREEFERRVRTLLSLRQHQVQELKGLESERAALQSTAEQLAEKYEDIKDRQEGLTKRAEKVLRLSVQKQPVMSSAEKNLGKELVCIRKRLEGFQKALDQVHTKQGYHKEQIHQWQAQKQNKDLYLNQSRSSTLRSNLTQVTEDISDLVTKVTNLLQEMSI